MSLLSTIYDRRITSILSKCKTLTQDIKLYRLYDQNIKIKESEHSNQYIPRLNQYITINDINHEIYAIKDNKLIDYFITDSLDLEYNYVMNIKRILEYINLSECDTYIFNSSNKNTNVKNIKRFEHNINTNNRKRKRSSNDDCDLVLDPVLDTILKTDFNYNIDDSWVAASKTRNSALHDRCLDYYDEYNISAYSDEPIKGKKIRRGFSDFVQEKFKEGIEFEETVVNYLVNKYKNDIVKICESYMARDKEMCIKTFKAMYRGIPIIYQGVLQNPENRTLGSVDLLIRNDYLNEITNNKYDIETLKSIFPHGKYYYAVDIKCTKMHFNVDNTSLRNNLSVKPFKFQLHVYNEALKHMQKVKTSKSFILGKGWKMEQTVNKTKVVKESNDFIDKLGTIDFSAKDDHIITEADDAVSWLHDLKSSTDWTHKPPSNINIYPNMCNTNDDGYRHIKQESAESLKDITLVAYLTPDHRATAFRMGIKTWDDDRLTSGILGVTGKTGELVDAILNTNRDKSSKLVFYKTLDPSPFNILVSDKLEYYIDFETIMYHNKTYVYMIGLGHVSPNNGWEYNCFTLDQLNETSERKMYDQLLEHIKKTNEKHNVTYNPLYYHWSSVEPYKMNKMIDNLALPINNIIWFDLYKYFRENVITVKGAFSHSLKSVGKGMFKNKLIDTYWDSNILMDNKIHTIANDKYFKNIDTEFNSLIKYNEVDCKIMYDILDVIRKLKI